MEAMTTEQENRIIEQAVRILEARKDERAKDLAYQLGDRVSIDLHRLVFWSAYILGAMDAATRLRPYVEWNARGDEKAYRDAEMDLVTKDRRSLDRFLGHHRIGYRNHQRDKKGRLVHCEAYFID